MKFVAVFVVSLVLLCSVCGAAEVDKGKIPAEHVSSATKVLPNDVAVWDVDEAVAAVKNKDLTVLWVDTRPASFFNQGTVRNAVHLAYDKSGAAYPDGEPVCTKEVLLKMMEETGADVVVFFCQGPKCHRSYNAAEVAVTQWGLDASQVVWFRAGYPSLFKTVSETAKLKRKAERYVCDASLAKF